MQLKAAKRIQNATQFFAKTDSQPVIPQAGISLDPRDTYANPEEWTSKANKLAHMFVDNFKKFEDNAAGKALVAAGPHPED